MVLGGGHRGNHSTLSNMRTDQDICSHAFTLYQVGAKISAAAVYEEFRLPWRGV